MIHRFFLSTAVLLLTMSLAWSDTFHAKIVNVKGNQVTYHKIVLGKPFKVYDATAAEAVANVPVTKYVSGKGKTREVEAVEKGLANPIFQKIDEKGIYVMMKTADVGENMGKITEISISPRPPIPVQK